eukprot:2430990-Amphidinium_carterae.1
MGSTGGKSPVGREKSSSKMNFTLDQVSYEKVEVAGGISLVNIKAISFRKLTTPSLVVAIHSALHSLPAKDEQH